MTIEQLGETMDKAFVSWLKTPQRHAEAYRKTRADYTKARDNYLKALSR